MKVTIKSFDVAMDVKNNGIEFDVSEREGGPLLGDLILTKTQLIWCGGKTTRPKGIAIEWKDFIAWAKTQSGK